MTGRVLLVGAGPGDPELLTLKAVRALRMADVVLHDDLVPPAILAYVRPGARLVAVGKRGGCRSTPQAFIEQLLIREARAGNVVVRLEGRRSLRVRTRRRRASMHSRRGHRRRRRPRHHRGTRGAGLRSESPSRTATSRTALPGDRPRGRRRRGARLACARRLAPDPRRSTWARAARASCARRCARRACPRPPRSPSSRTRRGRSKKRSSPRSDVRRATSRQAGLASPAIIVIGDVAAYGRRACSREAGVARLIRPSRAGRRAPTSRSRAARRAARGSPGRPRAAWDAGT